MAVLTFLGNHNLSGNATDLSLITIPGFENIQNKFYRSHLVNLCALVPLVAWKALPPKHKGSQRDFLFCLILAYF